MTDQLFSVVAESRKRRHRCDTLSTSGNIGAKLLGENVPIGSSARQANRKRFEERGLVGQKFLAAGLAQVIPLLLILIFCFADLLVLPELLQNVQEESCLATALLLLNTRFKKLEPDSLPFKIMALQSAWFWLHCAH